jgi:Ca2+-binding RTX toxin-like protein
VIFGDNHSPATSTQFTASSPDNAFSMVFTGDFVVSGGDIIGGTVTGYTVFAGGTKVQVGTHYALEAAAVYDAFQGGNYQLIEELLSDVPATVAGSKWDDSASGGIYSDKLLGKAGNDWLSGGSGDDVVKGGKGNDSLRGDDGSDMLFGGAGADIFHFYFDSTVPPPTHDKIKDFKPGEDHIGLIDFADVLPPGYLDKAHFHKGKGAITAEQVVIYDKKSGGIYYDADGNGGVEQFLLAKVKAGTKLDADDFFMGGGAV